MDTEVQKVKYEITIKDSECLPLLPGKGKLELGDIVSVTDRKNSTTNTFMVVHIGNTELDICAECDAQMAGACIGVHVEGHRLDSECAAPGRCGFRSIDKIMESL